MAKNTIEVDVKFTERLERARELFNKSVDEGVYKGVKGQEAKNKVASSINALDNLFKSLKSVDENDLKIIKEQFDNIFSTIQQYSKKYTSKTAQEIGAELDKANSDLADKEDKLRKLKQTKSTNLKKSITDIYNSGSQVVKLNVNGDPTKQIVKTPELVQKLINSGAATVVTNGKIDTAKLEGLKSNIQEYSGSDNEILTLTKEIADLNLSIQQLSNKLVEERQKGSSTDGGSGTYVQATDDKVSIGKWISDLQNKLSDLKNKELTQSPITITNNLTKQQTVLNKAFKAFTLYAIAIRGAKAAIREAKNTIVELDKYLTEQAMVTGKTREETYALIGSYQELALQTGATTKEIASVATEYMKQGKTIQDSLILTEAAVSAAKVARVSVGDSVNYLTTALNGFQLSAEDAMLVSDKFAAVAASSATDYDELAIALSKVASQANLAGMSIDYTTALLTKGLETTREAPETMGTALKTIIARMRELSDYGETLEGDTDLNNVESQLSYVGIALRNAQGELRSTEDVLDELGRKWDTLNTNQQAAVAKALAGTRQQSRLIAMMSDYERVIELQQIAQRSAGATSAQASVYLQGIEASLNKIRVSYEQIITNLSNNKVITGLLDGVAKLVDFAANFVDNWAGAAVVIGSLGFAITQLISKKIIENNIAKQTLELQRLQQIQLLKQQADEKVTNAIRQQNATLSDEELQTAKAQYYAEKATAKAIAEQNRLKKTGATTTSNLGETDANKAEQIEAEAKAIDVKTAAIDKALASDQEYSVIQQTIAHLTNQNNILTGASTIALAAQSVVAGIRNAIEKVKIVTTKISTKTTQTDTAATNANTVAKLANAAAIGTVVAAIAIFAVGIYSIVKMCDATKKTTEQIADLSNEIYTLNSTATKIDELTSSFDKLDKKLFKTKQDMEEMKDIAESLAETVDFTWGGILSDKAAEKEKANFEAMTYVDQIDYAKRNREKLQQQIDSKNAAILNLFRTSKDQGSLLNDSKTVSALRATNIAALQKWMDSAKGYSESERAAMESLGTDLIQNYSKAQLSNISNATDGVAQLAESLSKIGKTTINDEVVNVLDVLTSDDYELVDKVKAFNTISKTLSGDAKVAFDELYKEYITFSSLSDEVLTLIDRLNLTTSEINDFMKVFEELGGDMDKALTSFSDFLVFFENTGDLEHAIKSSFDGVLSGFEEGSDEYIAAYNKLVNAFEQSAGLGIQNIAQNLTGLENQISTFYEKALKWNEMTRTEQQDFISSNAEIFQDNPDLLNAVQTGNFARIKEALQQNGALTNKINTQLQNVQTQLAIERARTGNAYNDTYVQWLEEQEAYLLNTKELYSISYTELLSLEEKQLSEYKSYLQDQQDALTESLDKRKEAYEKYFDSIKETQEDEEFDDQVNLLTTNLAKLGASTNASAQQQRADIESQLKDLEKDRIQTLRERAQEAVLENLDDEVSEINEKFSKLLESNQMLLAAMTQDIKDPTKFATDLLTSKFNSGATALQMQDYATVLQSTFGSLLPGVDLSKIVAPENTTNSNNVVLNIGGDEITLNPQESDTVWTAIYAALQQIGKR